MKTMRPLSNLLLSMSLLASAAAAEPKYKDGSYAIDPMHSKVGFEIPHLVISTVEGRYTKFDGTVDMAKQFKQSKFKVSVAIASIDTGVADRDKHLRSPDFFDEKKYPEMTFESTEISGTPDAFKLTGNLTIKGITKKVTFDSKYLGTVGDAYGNQKAAFTAKAKISRKDFGLTWNNLVEAGPVVGDEVSIDIRIQAAAPAAPAVATGKKS